MYETNLKNEKLVITKNQKPLGRLDTFQKE